MLWNGVCIFEGVGFRSQFSEIIENINVDGIVEMLNKILEDTVKPSSD